MLRDVNGINILSKVNFHIIYPNKCEKVLSKNHFLPVSAGVSFLSKCVLNVFFLFWADLNNFEDFFRQIIKTVGMVFVTS